MNIISFCSCQYLFLGTTSRNLAAWDFHSKDLKVTFPRMWLGKGGMDNKELYHRGRGGKGKEFKDDNQLRLENLMRNS